MEEVQLALLRKASIAERISLMRSLTKTAFYLSHRAIRRANPTLSEQEVDLLFVKYHYGEDLMRRLRDYLNRRDS